MELFDLNRNNHILFRTINEAREVTEEWRTFYNNQRPHESLGNQTPMSFRNKKLFEYGYNNYICLILLCPKNGKFTDIQEERMRSVSIPEIYLL